MERWEFVKLNSTEGWNLILQVRISENPADIPKKLLDLCSRAWYCITVREENKAEFRSHLSAIYSVSGLYFSAQDCFAEAGHDVRHSDGLCEEEYNRVWILSALFFVGWVHATESDNESGFIIYFRYGGVRQLAI